MSINLKLLAEYGHPVHQVAAEMLLWRLTNEDYQPLLVLLHVGVDVGDDVGVRPPMGLIGHCVLKSAITAKLS